MSKIKSFFQHLSRKTIIWSVIIVVVIAIGAMMLFGGDDTGQNNTLVVKQGDFIQEVSISGKVVAAEAAELAFKTSGRVSRVVAPAGTTVTTGQTIIALDNNDEVRDVRDAELALASARIARDRLLSPTTQQVENNKLKLAYEDGLAQAGTAYSNLYTILDDVHEILFEKDFTGSTADNNIAYYVQVLRSYGPRFEAIPLQLTRDYDRLVAAYPAAFAAYQSVARDGSSTQVEQVILQTSDLVRDTLNLIKSARDVVQFFQDRSLADSWQPAQPSVVSDHLARLNADHQTINGYWLEFVDTVSTIKAQRSAVTVSDLDLQSQELEIGRRENNLRQAQDRLAETYLRAPFAGVVANISTKVGENVAADTVVAKLISTGQFQIESFVPEIYVSLIKLGDTARVTLDAYGDDVVFAAKVMAVEPAETIRDGVSTYKTTLQFDQIDPRIRSGMTANVVITTEQKPNVLVVPQGIVITRNGQKFVPVKAGGVVTERLVTVGSISSLGEIEILSGLNPGDTVILTPTTK